MFDYNIFKIHWYFPLISLVLEIIPEQDFKETETSEEYILNVAGVFSFILDFGLGL